MSCRDNGYYTIETGWILSKNQKFRETEMYQDVRNLAIEKFGFKTEDAIEGKYFENNFDKNHRQTS